MKSNLKYIIVFTLMFVINTSFSQSPCKEIFFPGTPSNIVNQFSQVNSNSALSSPYDGNPDLVVYPEEFPEKQWTYSIVFKIIRDSVGLRTTGDLGEAEVMNSIKNLNLSFNAFNIFF